MFCGVFYHEQKHILYVLTTAKLEVSLSYDAKNYKKRDKYVDFESEIQTNSSLKNPLHHRL